MGGTRCTAVDRAFPAVEFSTWAVCERLLPQAQACAELIQRVEASNFPRLRDYSTRLAVTCTTVVVIPTPSPSISGHWRSGKGFGPGASRRGHEP